MLVNPVFQQLSPQMNIVLQAIGGSSGATKICDGVYEINHFSFDHLISNIKDPYPSFDNCDSFGVCDDYRQVLDLCPELITSTNKYVISITCIEKSEQPPEGGWRWHKWGSYIGKHEPQHEYLYDEEKIDRVYVFHIYELED